MKKHDYTVGQILKEKAIESNQEVHCVIVKKYLNPDNISSDEKIVYDVLCFETGTYHGRLSLEDRPHSDFMPVVYEVIPNEFYSQSTISSKH